MENNKIVKIGAVCFVAYVGVKITSNVIRHIAKKIEEEKEAKKAQERFDKYTESMKKYDETKDFDHLFEAVFYM